MKKTFQHSFGTFPSYKKHCDELLNQLPLHTKSIVDVCVASTTGMLKIAGVNPTMVLSSKLKINNKSKTGRLIDLCTEVGATAYMTDSGGAHYINDCEFTSNNIDLIWHVWENPKTAHIDKLKAGLRNCSALNLLARSEADYIEAISSCTISRMRRCAEGR